MGDLPPETSHSLLCKERQGHPSAILKLSLETSLI